MRSGRYTPPGTPRNSGHIESFDNRLPKKRLNRNHCSTLFEARAVIAGLQPGTQSPTPSISAELGRPPNRLPLRPLEGYTPAQC
jgi:hypothetical protein